LKKISLFLYIILFFALCSVPSLLTVFGVESKNYEKRELAIPPSIMIDGTEYTKNFDTYFSENFALRPQLITTYAKINTWLFKTSSSDKVLIGKDSFLFFTDTMDAYMRKDLLSDHDIDQICMTLKQNQELLRAQGIEFLFVIAPNKNSIYPEKMPSRYPISREKSNMQKLYTKMDDHGINYIDVSQPLVEGKKNYPVYHKTDSHWNNYGAAVAYQAIMEKTQALLPDKQFTSYVDQIYTQEKTHLGDLSTMLFPASGKKSIDQNYHIEKSYDSKKPIVNLEAIEIITENDNSNMRALIFRDSFFNAQIKFFSQNFGYINYARSVPYKFEKASELNADIVILEIVERNIPLLLENLE
jgi:hypothetical protein